MLLKCTRKAAKSNTQNRHRQQPASSNTGNSRAQNKNYNYGSPLSQLQRATRVEVPKHHSPLAATSWPHSFILIFWVPPPMSAFLACCHHSGPMPFTFPLFQPHCGRPCPTWKGHAEACRQMVQTWAPRILWGVPKSWVPSRSEQRAESQADVAPSAHPA